MNKNRLDRLVLLLDTGSTTAVRRTAAQQLGEIQKQHPGELYNLLSRVICIRFSIAIQGYSRFSFLMILGRRSFKE